MAALRGAEVREGQANGKPIRKARHVDIKRRQGYVCKAYLEKRRDELREEVGVCKGCKKSGKGCKACEYVLRIAIVERKAKMAIDNEERIKEKEKVDRELKYKYATEEKISIDPGRTITKEEYRRSKEGAGYNTDDVWKDKSFTAVEEIKNWGKLGSYIHNMIGEDIKFVGTESAGRLKKALFRIPRRVGGTHQAD